jgi:2-dehydro-3-deoxygluconokinase
MIRIIFFGECMLEQSSDNSTRFGGDSLNSALYYSRTCEKTTKNDSDIIYYATAVGCDEKSEYLLSCWQEEGINTELVKKIADKSLGHYCITTNDKGERQFSYQRDDSAAKYYFSHNKTGQKKQQLSQVLLNNQVDWFYFSGISLAILPAQDCQRLFTLLSEFKKGGGKVIFDNNYRKILWKNRDIIDCYQQAMQLADIAFLTDEDEYALYGGSPNDKVDGIDSILKRYQKPPYQHCEIVIKQGGNPCIIRAAANKSFALSSAIDFIEVIEVKAQTIAMEIIIDTCAAGDAFSAGYLAKRLAGKSIVDSATFAHLLAGRIIQYSGAIIPRSDMADLMTSLNSNFKNNTD